MTKLTYPDLLEDDEWTADWPESRGERKTRPARAWRAPKPKRATAAIPADLADERTAAPTNHGLRLSPTLDVTSAERGWIAEHLDVFAESQTLTAVLRRVKGGKEANVYCCAAHPATGLKLVAAKLYRPRLLRNLRNDARYRQGRPILTSDGQPIDSRDWRMHKAIAQKSKTGLEATQASWLEYEYQTMLRLHQAGGDVPRPLKHGANVILMEYIGDETMPAPLLNQVALDRAEAQALFDRLLRNIEIMLVANVVHGDLSAYNVLYWQGAVCIIDFPQVVDPRQNREAYAIFRRDVERICQYFERYGVASQPGRLARDLWHKHIRQANGGF
jgi:RIO kinase 1